MRSRVLLVLIPLFAGLAVLSCTRKISVSPQPAALYTRTPTATVTPTLTQTSTITATPTLTATRTLSPTLTATATGTSTATSTATPVPPTFTATLTPTAVSTDTPTPSPSPTSTDTPADTPTPTVTDTPTQSVICTITPLAPTLYNEMEAPANGGPTGTNDNCGAAENVGTVSSGSDLEIHGVLSASGNTGTDYDWSIVDQDFYLVTIGTDGVYTLNVDCYTDGVDGNDFDILVFDSGCNYLGGAFSANPVETLVSPALTAGQQYYFVVIGWNGLPQTPYRFTISPP